jgi:hypothetical protein
VLAELAEARAELAGMAEVVESGSELVGDLRRLVNRYVGDDAYQGKGWAETIEEIFKDREAELTTERNKAVDERDEARTQMGRLASGAARIDADSERLRAERDDALAALAGVTPENYHTELRDRRNDDMAIRGILSPNGGPRVIAVEIGPTVAPAVEWLVTDRDSWRRLADQRLTDLVAQRDHVERLDADLAAATAERDRAKEETRQVTAQREIFRRAARVAATQPAQAEAVAATRLDGWLAISTPYRAPETMTTRTVDGRFEMFDASVPPGGWVCAEWGDDADILCRTPVESEPCPVHHPVDEPERMTDAEEAALLARQRDAVIALCERAKQTDYTFVPIEDLYAAVLHDPADEPTPRTWQAGDPEPGPEVKAVRDRDGDLWKRRKHKGGWRSYTMGVCQWHDGPIGWAPLTDATSEVTG